MIAETGVLIAAAALVAAAVAAVMDAPMLGNVAVVVHFVGWFVFLAGWIFEARGRRA